MDPAMPNDHLRTPDSLDEPSDADFTDLTDCEMDKPDENDGFIEVKKRRKASAKRRHGSGASTSTISTGTIITNPVVQQILTVLLKPVDPTVLITKLNPILIAEELDSHAPDGVIQVRTNYRHNILALDARNLESVQGLLSMKRLRGIPVHVYETSASKLAAGVIHGVPRGILDSDVKSALRATVPVHCARRLGQSESFKLMFAAATSPDYVTVGHSRSKVKPFIEKPLCGEAYSSAETGIAGLQILCVPAGIHATLDTRVGEHIQGLVGSAL